MKQNGVYYLHGLVVRTNNSLHCDSQKPALITSIQNYTDWITSNRSKSLKQKSIIEICDDFIDALPGVFKCFLICLQIHFWLIFITKRY